MIGYHFTSTTLRDGRPIPPVGEWLIHAGEIVPCRSGLHASEHPFDALAFAPGNTLHKVELDGEIVPHGDPVDKHVGRRRRIIATIEAEPMLREFARWCALLVIGLWDAPDVVRQYLETGDESLRSAARSAARAALGEAARAASGASAWAASWSAACDSSWAASWSAARDSSWAASWSEACDSSWSAAWDSSWASAWDSARDSSFDSTAAAAALPSALSTRREKFAEMVRISFEP